MQANSTASNGAVRFISSSSQDPQDTYANDSLDASTPSPSYSQPENGDASVSIGGSIVCTQRRIHELWTAMQSSLEGLAALGFDRTLLFSVLPTIQRQTIDAGVSLVYTRLQKRLSDQWRVDEPSDVVFLSGTFTHSYDELMRLLK
jgi:hypothetical protein